MGPEDDALRITERIAAATEPFLSFELLPPLRGGTIAPLLETVEALLPYRPAFIDVTSHAGVVSYEEGPDGLRRHIVRRRPGTLAASALIQHKYDIATVPHVVCKGFTRQETEDFLIDASYVGIDTVLAIAGDDHGYDKPLTDNRTRNENALELVQQIRDLGTGKYVSSPRQGAPIEFEIGVAGYPEKHIRSPNLEADVRWLKRKLDAGANYVVTQMFFDNQSYHDFVRLCREVGIEAPIIPALKVLTAKRQLTLLPKTFFINLPSGLVDAVEAADDEQVPEIGVKWARRQVEDLVAHEVPAIHLYVMQNPRPTLQLLQQLHT